ncbi:MAG TPA: cache domain-containing protein [Methanomethylovorans sp.]|nr:cache domain-containing protein [Methanomethylovorans sp.]
MDFKKIPINRKIVVMALILTILPATIVGYYAYEKTSSAIQTQLNERLNDQVSQEKQYIDAVFDGGADNLESMKFVVRYSFYSLGEPKISDGKIMFGDHTVNEKYDIVDKLKADIDREITVFQVKDGSATRVSTTITDQNGNRVIGTNVSDAVYDAVVQKGQIYKGRAMVVGKPHITYRVL